MSAPESAPGISIREFARREDCSDRLVRRAIKKGRISALPSGELDPSLVGTGWRRDASASADTGGGADKVRTGVRTLDDDMPAEAAGMVTLETAAKLLLLSAQWLRQLVKKGFIPQPEGGLVQLGAVVRGYIRFLKDEERLATKAAARSRIDAARAEDIELRVALRRRELIGVSEALAVIDDLIGTFRATISGIPARVTRDMPLRGAIEDEINKALNQAADRFEQKAAELQAGQDAAIAAETH